MKTAAITGASGFVGSNLVLNLSKNNIQVCAISRQPENVPPGRNIEPFKGSILEPETLVNAFKQVDTVFHCAAHITFKRGDFHTAYKVNAEGTDNVLKTAAACGVKKVVFLSACAVLGYSKNLNGLLDESARPEIHKNNPYAYTKDLAEKNIQKYVLTGLNVSIANISTVYGPGDRALNSGFLIKKIFSKETLLVPPGGTSYVTIDDLMSGLILIAEKGKPGRRYILCSKNVTYVDLYKAIADALQLKRNFKILPKMLYLPAVTVASIFENIMVLLKKDPGLISKQIISETFGYKYFNSQRLRTELGWVPTQSLKEAVIKAVEFYKKEQIWD